MVTANNLYLEFPILNILLNNMDFMISHRPNRHSIPQFCVAAFIWDFDSLIYLANHIIISSFVSISLMTNLLISSSIQNF